MSDQGVVELAGDMALQTADDLAATEAFDGNEMDPQPASAPDQSLGRRVAVWENQGGTVGEVRGFGQLSRATGGPGDPAHVPTHLQHACPHLKHVCRQFRDVRSRPAETASRPAPPL